MGSRNTGRAPRQPIHDDARIDGGEIYRAGRTMDDARKWWRERHGAVYPIDSDGRVGVAYPEPIGVAMLVREVKAYLEVDRRADAELRADITGELDRIERSTRRMNRKLDLEGDAPPLHALRDAIAQCRAAYGTAVVLHYPRSRKVTDLVRRAIDTSIREWVSHHTGGTVTAPLLALAEVSHGRPPGPWGDDQEEYERRCARWRQTLRRRRRP